MKDKNEKLIDAENLLKESGNSQESINEIMRIFSDDNVSLQPIVKDDDDESIRMRLLDEKDWRKRASLAARLISKSIE